MDYNSITGRLLVAMVALPIILVVGSRRVSAQTMVTGSAQAMVPTEPFESVQWRSDSDLLLGTAGLWSAGDDQGTSGPIPLRGIKASSQYVPDYCHSVLSEAYTVQTLDAGAVEMISSDNVPCYSGAADYVVLKNSGAVSGEWFQSNSRAGSK